MRELCLNNDYGMPIAIALAKSERAARHTAIRTLRGGDRPKSGTGEGMKTRAGREKRAKGAGVLTLMANISFHSDVDFGLTTSLI